jgi:DnaJ-class molecular chaperone
MSADAYAILGVAKNISQDELQKAYRALAKKLYPDLSPGNDRAEAQFKEVTRAYSLLGNVAKRARFDAGEIDEQDLERAQHLYCPDFADHAENPHANASGFSDFGGAEDIFRTSTRPRHFRKKVRPRTMSKPTAGS